MKQLLLSILMMLLPLLANADAVEINGIYYNLSTETNTAEVTYAPDDADYYSGDIVIPETVNYEGISYSVTSIGSGTFFNCYELTSITIPNSVTSIGYRAFYNCSSLTSITIPNSVTSIGNYAFDDCSSLTSITIPNSVTSIGNYAFDDCSSLTSITIPNSVTFIGEGAFSGCSGLTSITIPNSVTFIGEGAFSGCSNIKTIKVENGNTTYDSRNDCNAVIRTADNELIAGCSNTIIPNSVTSIGIGAFEGCLGLTSIIIPNSVTSIGGYAFYGCSSLTSISIPNSVTSIEDGTFLGCLGLTSVTIGNSVTSIGTLAFSAGPSLTRIKVEDGNPIYDSRNNCNAIIRTADNELIFGCSNTIIPNSVTSIGSYAFADCDSLTSIIIPNSVTSIGGYAFAWCSSLTSISIPNSVTSIADNAFNECSGLTSVTIGNSVTSIGGYAFAWCSSLTSISIPNSVTYIGADAFLFCTSLPIIDNCRYADTYLVEVVDKTIATCTIKEGTRFIGDEAFSGCSSLTSITIPNSVTSIGGRAFSGCSSLTRIKVEDGNPIYDSRNDCNAVIRTADNKLIAGCSNTVIPNSVTSIGSSAFFGCSGLTFITIPNSVTSIGNTAFQYCSSLTSMAIPNSVTSIGIGAFEGCLGLTTIIIGNSVTSIGYRAFYGCSSLTSVTSLIEEPFAIENTMLKNYNNATLYVPAGTKSKYEATDGWKNFTNIVEVDLNSIIDFADATVKAICVKHWDTNGDGMLSYEEAAAVTDLGSAFSYNKEITSFDELKYFTGLKSIGEATFYGCSGLTSISVPRNVTSIGYYAFSGCSGLTSVTIPESVTSIGGSAFEDCSGLTSVTIPESVTSIGGDAFAYCSGLTSVTIPNSVTSIGYYAFSFCENLVTIKVENGNTIYDSRNDCNAIIRTADNELIVGCSNTVIPNSVTSIGNGAFEGCSLLTSIIIPNSVTSIGSSAFVDCSSLTSITIPDGVTTIGSYAFKDCSGLTSLTFPNSLTTIEHHAFCGDSVLTSLVIPNSVTTIEECAFLGCSGLTSLTISNNLTSIENAVFHKCRNLTSVTIPNSVISIKSSAFAFCSGLTSITIPNSVTSIGWEAFKECSSLASVTIPNSVTSISYHAFYHCSSLTSVIIGNGLMSLVSAFESCNSLSSIQVASDNTYYDSREGCNAIIETSTNKLVFGCKTTVIPNSVTSIGSSAFEDCSGLTSITIPNSVTSIGEWAFIGCSSLTSITSLIEEPFAIDNYMFENYDNATLYVPVGTKSKYEATDGWKNFKNIVEMDLLPVDNGQTIDFGTDIDENTNLNGNIMDNVFVNVNSGDGSYDPSEGCIIVSKPTDDSAIDGKEIFGDDFKDNYTGVVFKLAPGEGTIKVEAQTTGNMVLKVKIGDGMPITMELEGKLKVSFPYTVSEDTYVYIYGGLNTSNNAKGMRRAGSADGTLKIYGIEVDSNANGIESLEVSQDDIAIIYNLNGHRINSLQRGINIIRMNDGTVRKVVVK